MPCRYCKTVENNSTISNDKCSFTINETNLDDGPIKFLFSLRGLSKNSKNNLPVLSKRGLADKMKS